MRLSVRLGYCVEMVPYNMKLFPPSGRAIIYLISGNTITKF